jgi:RNA polymerase sigma-70 factor (ECF subfamily)
MRAMSTPSVTAAVADVLTIADPADAPRALNRDDPAVVALVDAARAGSREAFGDLVALYQRVVFRTALAALGVREDAEDAAQEALLVAWTKLPGFRGDSTFKTWLLTIVWRKALDRRRVRRLWWSRTQTTAPDPDRELLEAMAGADPDPEARALARDWTRRIREEVLLLTPKLRDTLLLAATGEYTYEEISSLLALPVGTVKWRVSEARRVLSTKLKRAPEGERP